MFRSVYRLSLIHIYLQIALWYGYACMNIDEYPFYYRGVQWMRDSEKNAAGCCTWYFRYSIGLTYCGHPEEALRYACLLYTSNCTSRSMTPVPSQTGQRRLPVL